MYTVYIAMISNKYMVYANIADAREVADFQNMGSDYSTAVVVAVAGGYIIKTI